MVTSGAGLAITLKNARRSDAAATACCDGPGTRRTGGSDRGVGLPGAAAQGRARRGGWRAPRAGQYERVISTDETLADLVARGVAPQH